MSAETRREKAWSDASPAIGVFIVSQTPHVFGWDGPTWYDVIGGVLMVTAFVLLLRYGWVWLGTRRSAQP